MDLEKEIAEHGKRIEDVERDVEGLKKDLSEGLKQFNLSNEFLREQNREILKEVIKRNGLADQREFEITKMTKANQQKMFGAIFGAGGLIAVLFDLITRFVH